MVTKGTLSESGLKYKEANLDGRNSGQQSEGKNTLFGGDTTLKVRTLNFTSELVELLKIGNITSKQFGFGEVKKILKPQ